MNIENILDIVTNLCIYYYIQYNSKIKNIPVTISNNVFIGLRDKIYKFYTAYYTKGYVYDVEILTFPWGQQYILEDEHIDINEAKSIIDDFIDNYKEFYNGDLLPIISMSDHAINNYIPLTHNWIKWNIDLYRF